MKNWIFIGLLAAGLSPLLTSCANNVATSKVPEDVVTSFNNRYPNARNVKWEMDDGNYKASFMEGVKEKEAVYQPDGDLVRVDR